MDAGSDARQRVNTDVVGPTYHVDVWLPDAKDYSGLSGASPKVQEALGLNSGLPDDTTVVPAGEIKINLNPRFYKRDKKNLDIDSESVAAISFSEDFAKNYQRNPDEKQRAKNGNVAVLAMMGGVLPVGKNFFRMGFSVETIAGILGDHVIHDRQVSHVFLIRVDNKLGDRFEEEFSRKIESQNCSLDILSINADVKKATLGVLNENVMTNNNALTTSSAKFVEKKAADEKKSVVRLISQWLSNRIKSRSDEGLKSVVIYGYWECYWDFVQELLKCQDFRNDEDWLYVESNYPLLTPILRYKSLGIELTDIVEINVGERKEFDELTVLDEKVDNEEIKDKINPSDVPVAVEGSVDDIQGTVTKTDDSTNLKIVQMKSYKGTQKNKTKPTEDALGRVRCFTGKLVEKESSFITFAKETVRLLSAAIRYAHDKLGKEKTQGHTIPDMRKRICEFLRKSKFYASEHLGSFFFRKDGELFFPLYRYNGRLEQPGNCRESCCKGEETTKEAIADQLLQLSNSLNKITRAEIPRDLEVCNSDGAKEVFEEFSKIISKISKGIEIKFVSYYPKTERQFYTWTDTQEENVDKTGRFINVSIFDDVRKKIQGVIQINLKDFDLEDNDAYRVYLVYGRTGNGNVFDALTLAEWWNRQKGAHQSKILDGNEGWKSDLLPVTAVVFTKSRIRKQDGQTWEGLSRDEYKNIIDKANYVHYYRDDHESNFDEILRGLCQLLDCRQNTRNSKVDSKSNARFLYYIPEYVPEDNSEDDNSSKTKDAGDGQGGIVMTTRYKLSLFDLQIVENMVSRIFSKLKTCLAEHDVLLSNIKSAIGSIMSRNGSHNIGSHVLAALSHNVGTMPDDRVLYQYIQHRMDYIATATTEFPTWRQPTLFVNEVVKAFLCQKHLLNYIARSEGLEAYQFQNPTIGYDSEQPNTIRIHVRRLKKLGYIEASGHQESRGGRVYDAGEGAIETSFILYPDDLGFQKDGKWDAHLDKDIEIAIPGGEVGQHALFTIIENVIRNAAKHAWAKFPNKKDKHLDVYLDFNDNPKVGVVEFLVWTRGGITCKQYNQLVEKMGRKFISEEGKLQKENWGFAEMRISAGYLKTAKIKTIGGLDGAEACLNLICPVLVCPDSMAFKKCSKDDWDKDDSGKLCLGFRFDVYKPRELLILTESQLKGYDTQRNLLKQYGVWIMSKEEASNEIALPFSYVLLENFDGVKDANSLKLPFRIVCGGTVTNLTNPEACLFPKMSKKESIITKIKEILDSIIDDGDAKREAGELLEKTYCRWVLHLKEIAMRSGRGVPKGGFLPIVIDVAEESSTGGKGLLDIPDLMRFVLENTLNAALRSYLERCKDSETVYKAWEYILNMRPRPVLPLDQLILGGRDVKSMLARQVNDWYINSESDSSVFKCLVSDEEHYPNLTGFSEFLQNVILTQAESFLSKYEERFVTLPKSFGTTQPPVPWEKKEDWKSAAVSLLFTNDDKTRHSFGRSCLAYWRHYDFVPRDKKREKEESAYRKLVQNQDKLYLEPLSGSQSYLNAIISLGRTYQADPKSGHRLLTSLIETGLQHVLIIDERVSKFLQDHVDVALTFEHVGVSAMCDTSKDIIRLFKSYKPGNKSGKIPGDSPIRDYEIVIIHMGIIDKLLPQHESKDVVGDFIKYLKRSLRYVVVTTGRGTPSNLPDDARVLPFSVVESTMFKKYPEKMILVENVMNVLPVNKEEST